MAMEFLNGVFVGKREKNKFWEFMSCNLNLRRNVAAEKCELIHSLFICCQISGLEMYW